MPDFGLDELLLVPGDVVETVPLESEEGRSEAEYTLTWMVAGMPGQDRARAPSKSFVSSDDQQ